MADLYDLFGEDPAVAQAQARALADAMARKRAMGNIATVVGGPFAAQGRAFLGEAGQDADALSKAGQFQTVNSRTKQKMLVDSAQWQAEQARYARQMQEQERHNRAAESQAAEALASGKYGAVADPITGKVRLYDTKAGRFVDEAGGTAPTGPQPPNFKTKEQGDSFGYAARIIEARRQMEEAGYPEGMAGRKDAWAMGASPGVMSKVTPQEVASEPGQRYFNAARNLLAALLRKESGGAITDSEWEQFGQVYLPMPYDNPEARSNKLRLLDIAQQTMELQSGQSAQQWLDHLKATAKALGLKANTPSGAAPVTVKTKEERDALPAGTQYVGPDGKVYTKR